MNKSEALDIMAASRPRNQEARSVICDKISKADAWSAMMVSLDEVLDGTHLLHRVQPVRLGRRRRDPRQRAEARRVRLQRQLLLLRREQRGGGQERREHHGQSTHGRGGWFRPLRTS